MENKKCITCGKIIYKRVYCSKKNWETRVKYCSRRCIRLGKPSPFKGIPSGRPCKFKGMTNRWSEEWKQKLSERNSGITFNTGRTHIKKGQHIGLSTQFKPGLIPWSKGKKNPSFTGANNPRWKGGITPKVIAIRNSAEMKNLRENVFKRDNYTCVICKLMCRPGLTVILNAHHIKPFCDYPDLRLDINNVITVCSVCHRKIHNHTAVLPASN